MGKEAVNGNICGYWVWKQLMSQLCWLCPGGQKEERQLAILCHPQTINQSPNYDPNLIRDQAPGLVPIDFKSSFT